MTVIKRYKVLLSPLIVGKPRCPRRPSFAIRVYTPLLLQLLDSFALGLDGPTLFGAVSFLFLVCPLRSEFAKFSLGNATYVAILGHLIYSATHLV